MQWGWLITTVISAAIIAVFADYTHFTWWAATQFYVFSLLKACNSAENFVVVYLTQGGVVIVSIVAMSLLDCGLLDTAAEDYGLLYIPLNFGVHYLPLLIALLFKGCPPNVLHQMAVGFAILAVYLCFINPAHIYNCKFSASFRYYSIAAAVGILILVLAFMSFFANHNIRRVSFM